MASFSSYFKAIVALAFVLLFIGSSSAQLSTSYYATSCPNVLDIVFSVVKPAVLKEPRMGASLLRLIFHDCFVNGCDASILLDTTPTFTGEKEAASNYQSVRGFDVVDDIKSAVEEACPGVVSCADILAIASRDSVTLLGGPYWNVKLGRRDATTASQLAANTSIPTPFANLTTLIRQFNDVGLSMKDLVVLSGAHTIGDTRCVTFRGHSFRSPNIDHRYAQSYHSMCPYEPGPWNNKTAALDYQTPYSFDNSYYKNLLELKSLLHTDQQLYNNDSCDSMVIGYSKDERSFRSDFAVSMVKMADIKPLTGSNGEIRKNCRMIN